MPDRPTIAYCCDGTLPGVLCCIFESYTRRELPVDILTEQEPTLFPLRQIPTDEANARRVWASLERLGGEVCDWVFTGWLASGAQKEWILFQFIRRAYQCGPNVTKRLNEAAVNALFKLVRATRNEAHLMKEFLRFSEHDGVLASVIEPKAMVLPLIQAHFTDRYSEETLFIYDRSHQMALAYQPYQAELLAVEDFSLPPADQREAMFQALWKRYYQTTANQLRYNPKCRMTHMPKRFWKHMLEVREELSDGGPKLRLHH